MFFSKKAYFFILDAFIAATIIFVSLAIILNSDVAVEQVAKDYTQPNEITNFLLDTKLEDIDNPYVKKLISDGNISNPRNTIVQQVDLFYYTAEYICSNPQCKSLNYNLSTNLLMNISEPLIPQKYGFEYVIIDNNKNYTVYSRNILSKNKSDFKIVTKRISYVKYNLTEIFMPHVVQFSVWNIV